jgi:hypothetical protein
MVSPDVRQRWAVVGSELAGGASDACPAALTGAACSLVTLLGAATVAGGARAPKVSDPSF